MSFRRSNPRSGERLSHQPKSIGAGAVVCTEAHLTGDISIGEGTVVHPTATICAEGGPIVIGENNHIMEKTVIINKKKSGEVDVPMIIGNNNLFEFHSHCESKIVGSENVFESKSFVGERVSVSDNCVIGVECRIVSHETLPPCTVLSGMNCGRWTKHARIKNETQQQLEYLTKLLPNFHRTIRSS